MQRALIATEISRGCSVTTAQPGLSMIASNANSDPGDAMETSLSHSLTRLGAEELLSIEGGRGRCVVVFHGKVWITQHGDPSDHVVASGEAFTLDHSGLALIEALEPTSLVLLVESAQVSDSIGYEAAWPRIETTQAPLRGLDLQAKARRLRMQAGRKAAGALAQAARKLWSGVASAASERQVA